MLRKQVARRTMRARLTALSDADYQAQSAVVYAKVAALLAERHTAGSLHSVLLYEASPKWREVDVSGLAQQFADVHFDYVPVDPDASLPATTYDVVLVPLYGFTSGNYRLGHGSGWYDRFLATQPQAYTVGVGLSTSRTAFAPEPHDVPLSVILTEQ